jgi:hypothetical protein
MEKSAALFLKCDLAVIEAARHKGEAIILEELRDRHSAIFGLFRASLRARVVPLAALAPVHQLGLVSGFTNFDRGGPRADRRTGHQYSHRAMSLAPRGQMQKKTVLRALEILLR